MKVADSSLARRLDEVRPHRRVEASSPLSASPKVIAIETAPRLLVPGGKKSSKPAIEEKGRSKFVVNEAARRFQSFGKLAVFILMVVIPTIIAGVYYALFAAPQYVSEFRFSVRPNIGASSGSSSFDTMLAMSNSYIVSDYVTSRDAVMELEQKIGLRQHYSGDRADFLSRLDSDAPAEHLVDYWKSRVHTSYDITTGINVVEISAFSPEAAQSIALALKALCERLVNEISDAARKSQMDFALLELDRAEARLKDVRRKEAELRLSQNTVDARQEADGRLQLHLKLRGDLAALQSEYSALSSYMDRKSPRLTVLKNQIAATKEQIAQLQEQVSEVGAKRDAGRDSVPLTAITRFDELKTEGDIASKLYESSLTNYEAARAQANNNQIYLATYVQPSLPENAAYPRAAFDTFLIFLSASGVWVVLTLIYYSIRDHV